MPEEKIPGAPMPEKIPVAPMPEKIPVTSPIEKEATNDFEEEEHVAVMPPPAYGASVDEAMKAFGDGEVLHIDEATNKRLLRRIDLHIMPLMCIVYGLNYLDKTTLSYANVMGLKKDLKLKGDDYQWLGSMFYFGYLAWEYPTNRLLQRLPLAKYSSFNIIIWGGVLCCMAAVKNFSGAVAVRFFLGVFESAVTPGFALFSSQWYTKKSREPE
ncbi:uncharacterized protein KY384_002327 [Bacidia gigantensis]|uniref:uncharacterized protein n=1 Tax=Bacidia gigantensis TaxID=2732470 RepID=UPI001D03856A|nr:uncharacterized protein KY384_002327 [Bacidia gigantensis]KAG8532450.1 hypothetical protein KY384_002327 [Bacidia gigantensis]